MSLEQAFFLQILRDFINGLKTKAPDNLDWERIASYAKMHEVGGIVYHQCYGFIPVDFEPALEKSYSSAVFYYANREQAMKQVSNALKDVPFFTVKGTYDWISYLPYIRYVESAEEAEREIPELLAMKDCKFDNKPLMPYFEKLAEVIRNYAAN